LTYEIEIRKALHEALEAIADEEDDTTTGLVNSILSEWVEENYPDIIERDDQEDSDESDQEE